MWRAAAFALVACLCAPALACDYPGPPPGSGEATSATGDIRWVGFSDTTDRYRHGVLGDALEAGGLRAQAEIKGPCDLAVILPEHSVFEDISPRIVDLDRDGRNEIIVVETRADRGAALAIYGLSDGALSKLTATPNIGTPNRWLAPIAAADLDGDGHMEIAYIDRPHLAKTLRIWRYQNGTLTEVASKAGLTNHKIGWPFIAGGLRACDGPPALITADATWSRILATTFDGASLRTTDMGAYTGPDSLTQATTCP